MRPQIGSFVSCWAELAKWIFGARVWGSLALATSTGDWQSTSLENELCKGGRSLADERSQVRQNGGQKRPLGCASSCSSGLAMSLELGRLFFCAFSLFFADFSLFFAPICGGKKWRKLRRFSSNSFPQNQSLWPRGTAQLEHLRSACAPILERPPRRASGEPKGRENERPKTSPNANCS